MKCPKCSYLGFETGDRCKNCGYDFSLASEPAVAAAGLAAAPAREWSPSTLAESDVAAVAFLTAETLAQAADLPLRDADLTAARSERPAPAPRAGTPSLPLFHPASDQDDEPLIKLPAAPRPPLAVRRTPDRPRPRATPKPARRAADATAVVTRAAGEPALQFLDEPTPEALTSDAPLPATEAAAATQTSGAARRLIAAVIDHGILLAVDAGVVYFTLKMAGLGPADWWMLPPIPLAAFLGMLKAAYFCAFTLVGGQTIGKMAVGIRVVGDDGARLDPARAVQRTLTGAVSLLAAGLGFLPVLLADDRRAVHDRVARTRVIALPSGRHTK